MKAIITPAPLGGRIWAVPSKSELHRLLICAALSDKPTVIEHFFASEDIEATLACLKAMGCKTEQKDNTLILLPCLGSNEPLFDCTQSGSTLRFMLPIAAALFEKTVFCGSGKLPQRPIEPLMSAMEQHGVKFSARTLPFFTQGKLCGGDFFIDGNVSSQFVSGLLFALPLLGEKASIHLTSPLQSAPYVDITADVMAEFGVKVQREGDIFKTSGSYASPGKVKAGGDWSNAAFFLGANYLGSNVEVSGLCEESLQGDKEILPLLKKLGSNKEINISHTPDLLPILSVAAAFCGGAVFTGGARLRLKESDRLLACQRLINDLGGSAHIDKDSLIVEPSPLTGGEVLSFADHRIVMAAAIAATACQKEVTINDAEAVNKSYPGFFEDFAKLGGKVLVI